MDRYDIGITPGFHEAQLALAPNLQAAVTETLAKLQKGHASVNVHALEGVPYVGIAVSRDALRIIAHREGRALVLVHVGRHDPAYDWAKRHKVVRIGNVVRILATEEDVAQPPLPFDVKGPLADIPDKSFRWFGISPAFARFLRVAPDDTAVVELATHLDPGLGEALIGLATEPDNLDALIRAFEASKSQAPVSLGDALRDPINAGSVWVPPPGEEALAAALRGELDSWRVFLHPSQRRLVTMRAAGPVKVTGGPGTGKTVVALHRARFLAEQVFPDDPRPVLLTAFSRSLADETRLSVTSLCADAPVVGTRIDVRTLTAVAQEVLRSAGKPSSWLDGEVISACWDEAIASDSLGCKPNFYASEREHVVVRMGAWTEAAYLGATRTDRGQRLDRKQRVAVWKVLEAFETALARRGGGDGAALAREAEAVLREGASPWCAVVCDEVQDVGPAELRLLSALSRGQEGVRPDALFLVGDGHQRIYKRPIALTKCGVDVRGRSKRLRLNYRTTEGIRRAAIARVEGRPLEDDEASPLDGYRSLRGGPAPEQRTFASIEEEAGWIAERAGQVPRLLVLARTQDWLDQLGKKLSERGVSAVSLAERSWDAERVALCTLHRSKGLEAPAVVLAGMQLVPQRWPGEHECDRDAWHRREDALVYVGMTRARDWCGLSSVVP